MPGVSDPPVGNAELDSAFTLTLQGGGEVATTTGSAETPTAGASQSCPDVHGAGGSHAGGVMVQGTDCDTATSVITAYLGGSNSPFDYQCQESQEPSGVFGVTCSQGAISIQFGTD